MSDLIRELAVDYPLFYLDPDKDDRETYRGVVLSGNIPESDSLEHYAGDGFDRLETVNTPVGEVRVATFGNRHDFELVCRGIMAAKNGPECPVPASQGAAMFTLYNWNKIKTHLEKFSKEEQNAEFKRFTADKSNFVDRLVVLSIGPYSGVPAEKVGETEEDWIKKSNIIRRDHELTHVICRKLYPEDIEAIRDELIADAVGIYSAYGHYDKNLAKTFLGIDWDSYTGGRLENYTDDPVKETSKICEALDRFQGLIDELKVDTPFGLINPLMEKWE